jgi:hypothetical protein
MIPGRRPQNRQKIRPFTMASREILKENSRAFIVVLFKYPCRDLIVTFIRQLVQNRPFRWNLDG